eukprot:COSAG04_NODE_25746_length_303_cov_1.475490_2_plen_52_part_01
MLNHFNLQFQYAPPGPSAAPTPSNALKFDNEYYRNLMGLEWRPKEWDGPLQY